MFNTYSMTGTGQVALLVSLVLRMFGIEADDQSVLGFVTSVFTAVGFVLAIWGQVRRQDLKFGLLRK